MFAEIWADGRLRFPWLRKGEFAALYILRALKNAAKKQDFQKSQRAQRCEIFGKKEQQAHMRRAASITRRMHIVALLRRAFGFPHKLTKKCADSSAHFLWTRKLSARSKTAFFDKRTRFAECVRLTRGGGGECAAYLFGGYLYSEKIMIRARKTALFRSVPLFGNPLPY